MSSVTQCPACATAFRVVPDQLRVADGWVRCGHCGEVFVAAAHMLEHDALAPGQLPATDSAPTAEASIDSVDEQPRERAAAAPLVARHEVVRDVAAVAAMPVEAAEPSQSDAPDDLVGERGPSPAAEDRLEPGSLASASQSADAAQAMPGTVGEAPFLAAPAPAAGVGKQLLMWTLLLVLLLSLVLQLALSQRHWLAAHWPALRPALQALCEPLACRGDPLRQLDAVVIEGSAFQRLLPDRFRVSFTVRNNADLPVATPALELTLTDAQDQVLLRRVVPASELEAPVTLDPRAEIRLVRDLTVSDAARPADVSGYRLLLFHP